MFNLVLASGHSHDLLGTSAEIARAGRSVGVDTHIETDPAVFFSRLTTEQPAVVTINSLRWAMSSARFADVRDDWGYELAHEDAQRLSQFLNDGGGLLAYHAAVICFDGHPTFSELTGAYWNWDRSYHPPLGEVRVEITESGMAHPVSSGIADFSLTDEIYSELEFVAEIEPLMQSSDGQPLLWAREVGSGRVVTDLLGHDVGSASSPAHQQLLSQALQWLSSDQNTTPPSRI